MNNASLVDFTADYVDVGDVRMWRELAGSGAAVLLMHGAFAGASSWTAQATALVGAGFTVHVPERRGHAHTPDVAGPLTYSAMADDTIAYLEQEVSGPAHLVGWSDGAVVALLAALRRPELIGRLVLIGQYFNSSGKPAGSTLLQMISAPQAIGFLRTEYDLVSPDGPDHFAVVHAKSVAMINAEPELDLADFAACTHETLVLQGDRDEVTLEHSAAVAQALGNGRLAVLPGSHALPTEQPGPVNALLTSFLTVGHPQPLLEL